ncbi:uncharacterized protein Fot_38026 [Forsythia ovata]|uniref:Uncharacterized protein n=1 Tax=Forsythia ovata TaxID=205694 RepID=A0ABD1S0L8_9LAMI
MGIETKIISMDSLGTLLFPGKLLMTEMRDTPTTVKTLIEYLIVDKISSYHGVFGRPVLIELGTTTHTKFLCMMFSTNHRIATVRENKSESRASYTNAMKKFVD